MSNECSLLRLGIDFLPKAAKKHYYKHFFSQNLITFAHTIINNMGKLAIIFSFILSVFPSDASENRRHIHVVRPGTKRSHRGQTVAKIWIEENGEKKIEIAWSELTSNEERDIIIAIDEHWEELNRCIDDVFAGKKITIKKYK